ncbi:MAG TPA: sulfotransferase [Alphaproteobacteria bacterium]|nr:sulfotransferase [Alphaproteobacteria bacterium]
MPERVLPAENAGMPNPVTPTADQLFRSGQAAEQAGRLAEAEGFYRAVLAAEPNHAQAHAALGFLALRGGRPDLSRGFLARARQLAPDLYGRQRQAAETMARERRWLEAVDHWQRALALQPGQPAALIGLAEALAGLGVGEAARAAEDAATSAPGDARIQLSAAAVLAEAGKLDRAAELAGRARTLAPAEPGPVLRLGHIRRDQGRPEEAAALYREALALDPDLPETWLHLGEIERFGPGAPEIDRMEALVRRLGEGKSAAVPLLFALAKAYDEIGEFDRAFVRLERGNRLMAARLRYDPAKDEAWAERIIGGFDKALLGEKGGRGEPSALPIFILGMPRSGSTLAEQILASHPEVHGAGEIAEVGRMVEELARRRPGAPDYVSACRTVSAEELRQIGAASIARLKPLSPGKLRVTNKTPGNIFHIGFVHLALPQARFVETRRDPLETCFACWRMLFRSGVAFSYDLAHLGRYYRVYDRLMAHWRELLPERIFSLSYEGLIADQERVSRRLVEFAGLAWDPACLDFHRSDRPVLTASGVQVRQPLAKTPTQRWRNYERHLGPLIDALGPLLAG